MKLGSYDFFINLNIPANRCHDQDSKSMQNNAGIFRKIEVLSSFKEIVMFHEDKVMHK